MGERRQRPLVILALAMALLAAGCIGMTDDQATDRPLDSLTQDPGQSDDQMSASAQTREDEGAEPTQLPPFYARKTITVSGDISLDTLPVILATVNGEVTVEPGPAGSWELVATLTGRGESPEEAREQRDRMTFLWSIGPAGGHALAAQVLMEEDDSDPGPITLGGGQAEGDLRLTIPETLMLDLKAQATNGALEISGLETDRLTLDTTNADVTVRDVRASTLEVDTTNGRIDVEATATREVHLDTTNGDIVARLAPGGDGTIQAETTNGDIRISVPEDDRRGYDAEAETTNGEVTIRLQDGQATYDEDHEEATFRTDGYDRRDIRTEVHLGSTNGDIELGPS